MALKERQVIGRMCVINSVLEIGRKTLSCVNDCGQPGRGHDACRRHPINSYDRKTIRDKVTSCTLTKIVINGTMTKNKKAQWRLSPRANSYNTRDFGDMT